MKFEIGDSVTWKSQSRGYSTVKSGVVIAVVPAGESAHKILLTTGLKCKSHAGYGLSRNHESYLIKINSHAYWPRVKHLTLLPTDKRNV